MAEMISGELPFFVSAVVSRAEEGARQTVSMHNAMFAQWFEHDSETVVDYDANEGWVVVYNYTRNTVAMAFCSEDDQFDLVKGICMAHGRTLKALEKHCVELAPEREDEPAAEVLGRLRAAGVRHVPQHFEVGS